MMLKTIVPGKLYQIDDFLTQKECDKYIQYIDELEKVSPAANTESFKRFLLQPIDKALAKDFWDKLKVIIPTDISKQVNGCSERVPVVRYNPDARRNARHRDPRWREDEQFGVIIYLNTLNEENGHTTFYEGPDVVYTAVPKKGNAIIFDMDTWHRGQAPKEIKYIICPRLLSNCD
jgi:2OG-Fe(II) oxygenase superfamily